VHHTTALGQRGRITAGSTHEYTTCDDDDCPRFICRVYKEGFADGSSSGFGAGHAAGYAEGYGDGYAVADSAAVQG